MTNRRPGGWKTESKRLLTGLCGGLIVGMPLLYTMELWFIGMYLDDLRLVMFILLTLVFNFGLNWSSGFSEKRDFISLIFQSVTAYGMSAVISAIVLLLLGTITFASFSGAVGQIALAAIPVSFGFSVARTQFSRKPGEDSNILKPDEDPEKQKTMVDLGEVAISIAGATLFFFAVAPTEEIMMITSRTNGLHWAGLIVFSLLMTYAMVFIAEFAGAPEKTAGFLQQPLTETVLAYVLAVFTGLMLEFFLGRTEVFSSLPSIAGHAAVLGLPASVGAAAGRIIV